MLAGSIALFAAADLDDALRNERRDDGPLDLHRLIGGRAVDVLLPENVGEQRLQLRRGEHLFRHRIRELRGSAARARCRGVRSRCLEE